VARILIVDDEISDRLLVQTFLEKAGHQVFFALDGAEAMETYSREAIDVVITDLQMPNVHGLELITLLRDLSPPPPIIAVSGTGPEQLEMARALGASVALSKPVNPEGFLSAIDRVIGARP
jgi:two-component system, chemotaxis family, chemotaxis protein CheY